MLAHGGVPGYPSNVETSTVDRNIEPLGCSVDSFSTGVPKPEYRSAPLGAVQPCSERHRRGRGSADQRRCRPLENRHMGVDLHADGRVAA